MAWQQVGSDIDGEAASDYSGQSISLSSDGSVVAIGTTGHDDRSGIVRIYRNNGGQCEKIVNEIDDLLKVKLAFRLKGRYVRVGDPVANIVDAGKNYSVLVLGDSGKGTVTRFLGGGVSTDVMRLAHNSVMIMR